MIESDYRARFLAKPLHTLFVSNEDFGEKLQRDFAILTRMFREINVAHASAAQHLHNAVRTNELTLLQAAGDRPISRHRHRGVSCGILGVEHIADFNAKLFVTGANFFEISVLIFRKPIKNRLYDLIDATLGLHAGSLACLTSGALSYHCGVHSREYIKLIAFC